MSQLVRCLGCTHWQHNPFFDNKDENGKVVDKGGWCQRFNQDDTPVSALMGGRIMTSESFGCCEYSARADVHSPTPLSPKKAL